MTTTPLLPTLAPAQAAPSAQNPSPDNVLSTEGGGGAFLALLQGLPAGKGAAQTPMDALRQLLSALTGSQGKDLPDTFTPAQLAALVDKAGPKLKAALLQVLRDQSQGGAMPGSEADVLAMLQQLLGPPAGGGAGAETALAPSDGGARAAGTTAVADGRAGAGSAPGDAAAVLSSSDTGADTGAAGRTGVAAAHPGAGQVLPTSAAAVPAASAPLQALRHLLEAQAPAGASPPPSTADAGANPAGAAGPAAASPLTELFAKLFPHAAARERIDMRGLAAAGKALSLAAASDNRGSTGVPGTAAAAGGGSPAYAPLGIAGAAAAALPAAAPQLPVAVPFNQQGWDQALGHNLVWMARNDVQLASVRLNPPHLGPLEVRIAFNNDQATVSFVSHHGAVREAVESALPRLRDMFADAGVSLGNVDVSDQTPSGRQGARGGGDGPAQGAPALPDSAGHPAPAGGAEAPLPAIGLVDYFA